MKKFNYFIIFLAIVVSSCNKDSHNIADQKVDLRTNSIVFAIKGEAYDAFNIGQIHNQIVNDNHSSHDNLIEFNGELIDSVLVNYVSTMEVNKYTDLFTRDTALYDEIFKIRNFNHNILIDSINAFNNLLISEEVLSGEELSLLNSFYQDLFNLNISTSQLKQNYITEYLNLYSTISMNAPYGQIYVGGTLGIMLESRDFWDSFNYSSNPVYFYSNGSNTTITNETSAIPTPVGADLGGAVGGTIYWFYDNWDCLDWGCDDQTGKRLLKSMGWGAAWASTGGRWFGKLK